MLVTKRNGTSQELDLSKLQRVVSWAVNGDEDLPPISGVSESQIELAANLHFYDNIKTADIQEVLIKSASSLITEITPNYDQVAARLTWFAVRKSAFLTHKVPSLLEIVKQNVTLGLYTAELLSWYSEEEYVELNNYIDHTRDDLFRYAGAEQMRKSYLVQNRKSGEVFETFQIPFILVPMVLFATYEGQRRLDFIKDFYDCISMHYISLPTPIMAGCRTNVKQFSSCCVIKAGDSIDSICAAGNAIVQYSALKAGIGLDVGMIRAINQPVRNGDAITTGMVPFIKKFNADLKCTSQGAIRGASANVTYPIWHLEFESLIELKNSRGVEETRVRTVDYTVSINGYMYKRLVEKKMITLFSPEEVPDLYEAFHGPSDVFGVLYEQYEANPNVIKKQIPAVELFSKLLSERFETGRIYITNVDLANTHTPFRSKIYSSNLCEEILLPTEPVHMDGSGEIALCTLGAINVGKFSKDLTTYELEILAKASGLLVRALDALLDYQSYPVIAAKRSVDKYRPLGIGVIGFAHWLAKAKLQWGKDDTLQYTEDLLEAISYNLINASVHLAEELGSIPGDVKYKDGIFPKDTAKNKPLNLKQDWDTLGAYAKRVGIRNATLMALMPSESSSKISNETNGIEPPRDLITVKGNKNGVANQVVPEFGALNYLYETLWSVDSLAYLRTVASMQKFVDQSISTNTSYDPNKGEIKMTRLIRDMLEAYKLGIKTLYYSNTNDGNGVEDTGCASGACKI